MTDSDEVKLLPCEPTQEMIEAGIRALEDCVDTDWDSGPDGESHNTYTTIRSDAAAIVYRAMAKAATRPPVVTDEVVAVAKAAFTAGGVHSDNALESWRDFEMCIPHLIASMPAVVSGGQGA